MMRKFQRGMTLVELLVAMAMGVAVVLVVSTLLVAGENHKRTTTSTNDADQTGAYAFHALDRALRGAGSAIAESAYPKDRGVLGCKLNVGNSSILPRTASFPAPFTAFLAGTTANLRVAPILIGALQSDSNTSDVLVVMSGSGAAGGVSRAEYAAGTATSLLPESTVAFNQYDMVLVTQPGIPDCLLEEVSATSASALTLGTTSPYYHTTTSGSASLATLAGNTASYITPLGNAAANNVQFLLFGVGTNYTLYSYDLLQNATLVQGLGADTSQAITDGVIQMNAIYGVATTAAPSTIDHWAAPTAAQGYDIATVMTSPAKMQTIIAVRVALVVRGEYYDKNVVSPTTLTIFSGYQNTVAGVALSQPINLTADQQHYRYRVFEFTVPLRNMILLAGA
jgi:type IV pilus assembly protein PilW